MRVTIEHREEAAGITGARRRYFVDCTVEFSEEERAIIKARDLSRESLSMDSATPLPGGAAILGTSGMMAAGPLLIIASLILGFGGWVSGNFANLMFFGGIGLWIYGWLRGRRIEKRLDTPEQTVTVRQLLAHPTFTVHADNAGLAKLVEEEIRQSLVNLKTLIDSSADVPKKQTFEL